MRDIFTLFLHAIVTIIRSAQPGGVRAVVAESVLMRHQVLILNRGRKRAPNLRSFDRIIAGLCTLMMRPARVLRSAVVLKTSTLLHSHKMLVQQKYRLLFSPKRVRRPGPKGPTKELIAAVVEMKRRNCSWGCKRIAEQIALAFGVDIDKDVVRRILATHFHPEAGGGRTVMAFFYRERERLTVVAGFISMRVRNIANVLGFGRYGSIYPTDRGLRRSPRRGRWTGVVQNVQSRDSRTDTAEISEFGS